jgi:hypothetical protein
MTARRDAAGRTRRSRRAAIRAFVLAPLTAPLAYFAALVVVSTVRSISGAPGSAMSIAGALDLLVGVAAAGAPIAYAAALVGGVPLYGVLASTGRLGRPGLWAGGAAIGAATSYLIRPLLRGGLFSLPLPLIAGAALGLIAAEAFYLLLDSEREATTSS